MLYFRLHVLSRHMWYIEIFYLAIFISYPLSTSHPYQPEGWYGVWYENCHIIIYSSYLFFLTNLPIWYRCGVKGKTVECSECGDKGFLHGQRRRITHVTYYHTIGVPQEWYALENHVSITYAKWTHFLVNVWYLSPLRAAKRICWSHTCSIELDEDLNRESDI